MQNTKRKGKSILRAGARTHFFPGVTPGSLAGETPAATL